MIMKEEIREVAETTEIKMKIRREMKIEEIGREITGTEIAGEITETIETTETTETIETIETTETAEITVIITDTQEEIIEMKREKIKKGLQMGKEVSLVDVQTEELLEGPFVDPVLPVVPVELPILKNSQKILILNLLMQSSTKRKLRMSY